ncbi:MAG: DUF547 domain-containing protein [Bacteroidota bacterium]
MMKLLACVSGLLFFLNYCQASERPPLEAMASSNRFNTLSEQLLTKIKAGEDTESLQKQLSQTTVAALEQALTTDAQRNAFWINIYNAYIQLILKAHPEYYDDRDHFFNEDLIDIAGNRISFAKIEHGILRRSKWSKGLGYVSKLFPDAFERSLRVAEPDYRIHFALNCGAKDCPPIAIYTPTSITSQLARATGMFINATTVYEAATETATISSLFLWFRGDFGGESGIQKILEKQLQITIAEKVQLRYSNYDWTLLLDNYITF